MTLTTTTVVNGKPEIVMDIANTGATWSIMGLTVAKRLGLKFMNSPPRISLKNASGNAMKVEGMVRVFIQPDSALNRRMVNVIMSSSMGDNFLLGFEDLFNLRMCHKRFPKYIPVEPVRKVDAKEVDNEGEQGFEGMEEMTQRSQRRT